MLLPRNILELLQGGTLFYPCSGYDVQVPLQEFAPYVHCFWFVDLSYSCNLARGSPSESISLDRRDYQLIDRNISYPPSPPKEVRSESFQQRYPWIEPCKITVKYRHVETNQVITIHYRRGYGTAALRREIDSINVFFYRGDSPGEGGSGTLWLQGHSTRQVLIEEVLKKLKNDGLVVTDGSNCPGGRNPYKEFARFHFDHTVGAEAVNLVSAFKDKYGRHFRCVGYVGERYGPTLAWQVHHL